MNRGKYAGHIKPRNSDDDEFKGDGTRYVDMEIIKKWDSEAK